KIIMQNCGGASGPIWGTAFRQAGRYAKGKGQLSLEELSEFSQAMVDGVQAIGGAKLGDKTLLDALIPATESLKASAASGEEMRKALDKSAEAADKGAEGTREISAAKGRASYLGERSIGRCDAGAKAVAIILKEIARRLA
ncbi:MAG: DAK2 domain-containing protein, partial [Spirochaetales bacterium]|nr:DAK2 domain-containing protein [Spirochaetales bacterium]